MPVLTVVLLGTACTGEYYSTNPFVGAIVGWVVWREPGTTFLLIGFARTCPLLIHRHMHYPDIRHEHNNTDEEIDVLVSALEAGRGMLKA